jgi:hypothetical protein
VTSFVWSWFGSYVIKSLEANYAFLDEMQDYWKWEVGMFRLWISDFGLRIYGNTEGAYLKERAFLKNEAQNIQIIENMKKKDHLRNREMRIGHLFAFIATI